mgnify:CR=1 FL=1
MTNWDQLETRLNDLLKLRVPPLAVVLLEKVADIPGNVWVPEKQYTFCQLTAFARFDQRIVAGTIDNSACAYAKANLGLTDWPKELLSGRQPWVWTRNPEDTIKNVKGLTKIKQTFQAVLVSPLRKSLLQPDVVMVIGNSAQMMRLLNAYTWITGGFIYSKNAGHCGVCSAGVATPYQRGKPHLAIPCSGARTWGRYTDDEIIFGIPGDMIEEITIALEEMKETGEGYPISPQIKSPPREMSKDKRP